MLNPDNVHLFANGHYPSLTTTVSAGRRDAYLINVFSDKGYSNQIENLRQNPIVEVVGDFVGVFWE